MARRVMPSPPPFQIHISWNRSEEEVTKEILTAKRNTDIIACHINLSSAKRGLYVFSFLELSRRPAQLAEDRFFKVLRSIL